MATLAQRLEDEGYEDILIFESPGYDDACIGISEDNRAVYSYDRMIRSLMEHDGLTYDDAADFIDYNTIRALPYAGKNAPVIVYEFLE